MLGTLSARSKLASRLLVLVALAMACAVTVCTLDRGKPMDGVSAGKHVGQNPGKAARLELLRVRVIERHPHASDAFTQGLFWHEGVLYEGTGGHGDSSLRLVELSSGSVLRQVALERQFFGEGITRVGDRIIQLTWQSHKALVYDAGDFKRVGEFSYDGEGWGLCYDGRRLIMSDGSARLQFRDPETFELRGQVQVTINGRPQPRLNELECVDGQVYANVWQYEQIVRIDPENGQVTAIIDAAGLLSESERAGVDVLNGIAYLPERKRFLITGKFWPHLFEVEFVPR